PEGWIFLQTCLRGERIDDADVDQRIEQPESLLVATRVRLLEGRLRVLDGLLHLFGVTRDGERKSERLPFWKGKLEGALANDRHHQTREGEDPESVILGFD